MARLKNGINVRVKASTLVEVTISLVIITMIFSIAMVIYLNIQSSGFSNVKLLNKALLDEAYAQVIKSKDFEKKEEIDYDHFILIRSSSRHPQNENMVILLFEIRNDEGKLLAERKHLLYVPK
jgi:hypothetical protein